MYDYLIEILEFYLGMRSIVKTEFYSDKKLVHKMEIKYFKNQGFKCVVDKNVNKIYWKYKQDSPANSSEIYDIAINFPYDGWEIIGTIVLIPLYFKSIITSIINFYKIYLGIYNDSKSRYDYK